LKVARIHISKKMNVISMN